MIEHYVMNVKDWKIEDIVLCVIKVFVLLLHHSQCNVTHVKSKLFFSYLEGKVRVVL